MMQLPITARIAALALILFASTGAAVAGPAYTVQPVQYPTDTAFTELLGINNAGTIAGFHGAVTAQGFTLTLPNAFTSQNVPKAYRLAYTSPRYPQSENDPDRRRRAAKRPLAARSNAK